MMNAIRLSSTKKVVPMIYSYSTPEIKRHDGWTKIGYTEKGVEKRIIQQTKTADLEYKLEWKGNAIFDDGSGEYFSDHDFHAYLSKNGIERQPGSEWFNISGPGGEQMFFQFRKNRGILSDVAEEAVTYKLRKEQQQAVENTAEYYLEHKDGEYLWNAKPRFGKTLSVYDFLKLTDAVNTLIVTNRPAIANSWYSDYVKFLGEKSGYLFVSDTPALSGKKYVVAGKDKARAIDLLMHRYDMSMDDIKIIQFVSLQDMKGSKYFGGKFDKLKELKDIKWDILVVDERHEGIDTYRTDVAFDQIRRDFTLHLSGTPFKALANEKFPEKAIFNWTYADEQRAKYEWNDADGENPYGTLPQLNMYTYQMSEIIADQLDRGIEINGESEEYAFDLNEFFKVENGRFAYNESVDRFLDALTTQLKFPFSTEELRNEIRHSFWLLDRVESARLLSRKLQEHPVFKDYTIVLAAGDGKIDDEDELQRSFDKVTKAIRENDRTITLSVGQLTTGVTIPEWTAVLMLSNVKSPALYMQAAFRAQNPCLFKDGTSFYRKENAYVFDFDPARTLDIFEQFANDLSNDTSSGKGDLETRTKHIRELLNFFPVIGEDENGEMIELDAAKVLSIPRRIRSVEVVKRGFMSNFLFDNISNVFGAAASKVYDILNSLEPIKQPKPTKLEPGDLVDIPINKDGEIEITEQVAIGNAQEKFGPKIFETVGEEAVEARGETIETISDTKDPEPKTSKRIDEMTEIVIKRAVVMLDEEYKGEIKKSDIKQIHNSIKADAKNQLSRLVADHEIRKAEIESNKQAELDQVMFGDLEQVEEIIRRYDDEMEKAKEDFSTKATEKVREMSQERFLEAEKQAETKKAQRKLGTIEDDVRDHLRGFSRTIPSFLMAYGDDYLTLANFDEYIEDEVFKEVTSISLDDFRFLRDGGDYVDKYTGEELHYEGHLFEETVFNDSVKEFLRKRRTLANYFEDSSKEDIFDYIPPQKTNQIFTPKKVVKQMVDLLEKENPGCFDDPAHTFMDLYMKSGLYITEIVKRLYRSKKLKALYPDDRQRLEHIFEEQVYGLAPTRIIYNIATNYILGFDEGMDKIKHNFRMLDATPFAEQGTLEEKLDEIYAQR